MKVKLRKKEVNGKERIIMTFLPKTKEERQVMRSIATANKNETIFIKNTPTIEVRTSVEGKTKLYSNTPADWSKPENIAFSKAKDIRPESPEALEASSALRSLGLAKMLGCKIPRGAKPKAYDCRCGLVFTHPLEWRKHLKICKVLVSDPLFSYGDAILEKHKKEEIEAKPKKVKEEFECRCGHIFYKKAQFTRHQKICSSLREAEGFIRYGKKILKQVDNASEGKDSKRRKQSNSRSTSKQTKNKPRRKNAKRP